MKKVSGNDKKKAGCKLEKAMTTKFKEIMYEKHFTEHKNTQIDE